MRAMTGGSRTTARRVRIEWILAACCAWAPLVAQAVAPRISVIMVDDFDGQPNSMNSMFGGRDRINGGTLLIESQTLAGKAIRYIYDVTTTDAGWFTRLDGRSAYRGRDLSAAVALRFHVRGVASTTRIRVELRDSGGASATADVTGITSTWQEMSIDLTTSFAGVDRAQLVRLAFLVPRDFLDDPDYRGSLYFDDICFQTATAEPADDGGLLLDMARRGFHFFWDLASPITGLSPDRATDESAASVAGVGYQLASLPIGVQHGWVTREEAAARARLVLETLALKPQRPDGTVANENAYTGYKGFFYHFLDSTTGLRAWNSELSSIDSTLCFLGVIHALMFFDGASADEVAIHSLADTILDRTDWMFMYDAGVKQIWMEWKPGTGLAGHWDIYTDENITMSLLAAASRTHPTPIDVYYGWRREQKHYASYAAYASWTGTQFTYYQAQNWLDLAGRTDRDPRTPVNWFRNSWAATRGERQFAMNKSATYSTYGPNAWGISDSSVPGASYYAPLARPRLVGDPDNDNGTIPCAAAGATLTFFAGDPDGNLAMAALRHYYQDFDDGAGLPRLWKIYGPVDAFNSSGASFWFSNEAICLGQGALLLALENQLSDNAVGKRTGSFQPLADVMNTVMWPAGDINDLIYAREAEQWDAHSAGAGMTNEYHAEASSYYTFQLGTAPGNNVSYVVKNYWEPGQLYRLRLHYSEDVPGNIIAVKWDGVEIGRFTTQYSGGWLTFITSPYFEIGPVDPGDHTLGLVNINGGTYGVNIDVVRVYARCAAGDVDCDGDVDLADYAAFADCMAGPDGSTPPGGCSQDLFDRSDLDNDADVDVDDFADYQHVFGGP